MGLRTEDMLIHFTHLEAWKSAMELSVRIHNCTKAFPKDERYGVVAQMRKAATSVPANIAEGFGRYTYPDKMHKYVQARGELVELMNFLHYCERVGYVLIQERDSLLQDCDHVHKLLNGLISKMSKLQSPKSSVPSPLS